MNNEDKILKVNLLFDQKMDGGFQTIIENKMKAFDLAGITKHIIAEKVGQDLKLENKELESNFTRYIRHTLGENIEGGITDILIKFPDSFKMEIYFA